MDLQYTSTEKMETINGLIDFKFSLEKEISHFHEINRKLLNYNHYSNNSLSNIKKMYEVNINFYNKIYIEKQNKLLDHINSELYNLCEHDWVEDTIEDVFREKDICYCGKCFVRQK